MRLAHAAPPPRARAGLGARRAAHSPAAPPLRCSALRNSSTTSHSSTASAAVSLRLLTIRARPQHSRPDCRARPCRCCLTFATDSVEELLANWAAHLPPLRLPAVVAAMDAAVLDVCPRLGVHCLAAFDEASERAMRAEASRLGGATVNIRGNPGLFNSLGGRKVAAILDLLHASGRAVLVSDVDVVWLSDPTALVTGRLRGYEDFAYADILGSTDCLDPALDVSNHGYYNVAMDRNTGVLVVHNTTAARAQWRSGVNARGDGTSPRAWETDQTAFDDLLRGRGRGHRRNMTDEQRRDYFELKKDWCSFPASASGCANGGCGSLTRTELRPWSETRPTREAEAGCAEKKPLEEAEARLAAAEAGERFLSSRMEAAALWRPWRRVPSDPHAWSRRARGAFGGDAPAFGGRRAAGEGIEPHRRAAAVPLPMRQVLGTPRAVRSRTSPTACLAATTLRVPRGPRHPRQRVARQLGGTQGARPPLRAPGRADGPPTDGFPYRTHGWLAAARAAGTAPRARRRDAGPRQRPAVAAIGWRRAMHGGELATAGETVALPRGATARALRERARTDAVLATRPLLRVSLSARDRCCLASILTRGPSRAAVSTAAVVLAARRDWAQRAPRGCARQGGQDEDRERAGRMRLGAESAGAPPRCSWVDLGRVGCSRTSIVGEFNRTEPASRALQLRADGRVVLLQLLRVRVDLQRLPVVALRVLKALELAVANPRRASSLRVSVRDSPPPPPSSEERAEGGEGGAGVVDAESVVALLQVAGGAVGEALAPEEEASGARGPSHSAAASACSAFP